MTFIHNGYDCANNSRKWICNAISIETNTFGTSTSFVPITRRSVCVLLPRWEILTCRRLSQFVVRKKIRWLYYNKVNGK